MLENTDKGSDLHKRASKKRNKNKIRKNTNDCFLFHKVISFFFSLLIKAQFPTFLFQEAC